MKTETKSAAVAVLLVLAGTGCTTFPAPTPKEELQVWLAEAPRSVAVEVDPNLPTVTLRTRKYHGEGIGKGIGQGAVGSIYAGCMAFPPIGCLLGVVLAPVGMVGGAVVGAVAGKNSSDSVQPADNGGEGPAKMKVEQAVDLPGLLGNLVVANGTIAGPHSMQFGNAVSGREQATLRLYFSEIEWFGDTGENPDLKFTLRVGAELRGAGAIASDWGSYTYTGGAHWVSTWLKQDGKLLRDELRTGLNTIAKQAAADLHVKPSRVAIRRVEWAHKRAADPELDMWVHVRDSTDSRQLQSYVDAYPEGRYVQDAKKRIAEPDSFPVELREEGKCIFC